MSKDKLIFTREVIVVVVISILLFLTAIYLFFDRNFSNVEYVSSKTQSEGTARTSVDANMQENSTSLNTEKQSANDNNDDFKRLGICKDHDETAPYFVKSFVGNYLYEDGRPIADYCIEDLETTQLVEHYCTDEGELATNTYRCEYGCMLGACLTEAESRGYAMSDVGGGSLAWEESGVAYSIVGGYFGEQFATLNTEYQNGELIPLGRLVNGLALIINVENTNNKSVCAPLSLRRVVDETGTKIDPNINEFNFDFSGGGCELPANTMTQYKILFITDETEDTFVLTTGKDSTETFVVTANNDTGAIELNQTVPLG